MKSKSTIEVNGKRYDAATGTVLGAATAPPLRSTGRNIDGFFRPRTVTVPVHKTPPVSGSIAALAAERASAPELKPAARARAGRGVNHARPHTPQPAKTRTVHVTQGTTHTHTFTVRRGPANHVHHHSAQRSRTLRRDAVPAPTLSTHNLLKPQGALQHKVPSLIALKKSAVTVDPERLVRAQTAPKSPLIAHHAEHARQILPTFAPVAVQPPPEATAPGGGSAPEAPSPQQTNRPANLFEHAITNANHFVDTRAQKAQYRRKARAHVASMALGSLALIIIAAFVAYQNNPGLQLKVASLKAGVNADLPNFAAAGFTYNGVQAGNDKLVLGFRGGSGTYQLTQTNTNLSDMDMIQSISATDASGAPIYSTVLSGDTLVYRSSNTNATWVSGGKWYTVSGTGALTNSQVKALVQHV